MCALQERNIKKIKTMFFLAVLVILYIAVGCHKPERKQPVRITLNVWPGYAHAFIAQEKGFFEKHNVNVELLLKKDISESKLLFINGEADGLFNVFPDILMLNAEGMASKIVYISDYSDIGDVIIGKSEFGSLSELKNRTISFEGVNSFSHIFVLRALEQAGIKEFEVNFTNLNAMDVLEALENGKIDAGHTWEPVAGRAIKSGYHVLSRASDVPGIIIDVLAFRKKFIKERPEEIRGIVEALFEAQEFISSNREEALSIMAKAEGMSVEEMEKGMKGVHLLDRTENIKKMSRSKKNGTLYGSGEYILDFFKKRGQMSKRVSIEDVLEKKIVCNQ